MWSKTYKVRESFKSFPTNAEIYPIHAQIYHQILSANQTPFDTNTATIRELKSINIIDKYLHQLSNSPIAPPHRDNDLQNNPLRFSIHI